MATRQLLADLVIAYQKRTGVTCQVESVGGVDAAKRVASGESFDLVLLASDAIDDLIRQGKVALGFQQRSEMVGLQGVQVLGPLPDPVAYTTVFSAGVPHALHDQHPNRSEVDRFLAFLASSDATPFKHQHGMSELP